MIAINDNLTFHLDGRRNLTGKQLVNVPLDES